MIVVSRRQVSKVNDEFGFNHKDQRRLLGWGKFKTVFCQGKYDRHIRKPAYSFQVMSAVLQLRQAFLTALYRDPALLGPHHGEDPYSVVFDMEGESSAIR